MPLWVFLAQYWLLFTVCINYLYRSGMDTINQHQKCIEILENIQSKEMTKRHLTDSYFNVKTHFPHLAERYIKQINDITINIFNLHKNYKTCLKLLTNK